MTRLRVKDWRNLRQVDLHVDPDASLVCLVGENGTGKSAVLELLSAAAHQLGIAQGVEIARGNPLDEPHEIEVVVQVPSTDLELPVPLMTQIEEAGGPWNGELSFVSRRTPDGGPQQTITAPGLDEGLSQQLGQTVVQLLRQRKETQHLYLDADRAYPPMQIEPHRYGEIWQQEWESPEFTRQWAYRPTRTLYEEWMKYFLGVEERCATEHVTGIRRARDAGEPEPVFVDPFDSYRATLHEVLPHLHFVGVESSGQRRTPLFDSAGLELAFSRLSGGEREVAFLIGQVDRFRLQRGLLLIDEPELHLNSDLLRNWLAFLRDTVKDGQVWIATHSLEAVEVAGPTSTFVFERDPESRTVTAPTRLEGRPVLSALSAAVGSPAFALSRLRFVYIEGDRQSRERERFYAVCGNPDVNRFLEGGSCNEVIRRLRDVRTLAYETDEQLHVGGVIDRDFKNDHERMQLQSDAGVHVLGCHEVENRHLYLQPDAISILLQRAGRHRDEAATVVRESGDHFAGLWVAHNAASRFPAEHDLPKSAVSALGNATMAELNADWAGRRAASVSAVDPTLAEMWEELLAAAWTDYMSDRDTPDWFRRCLGKQTLGRAAAALDFKSGDALERQVVALWNSAEVVPPEDLVDLRTYVGGLGE
ncbi:MAG: AAA family ATPase [Acidimicrobiia bacterium]|nr:AAA family ATPase [Acidimicrobiia bacterium]